jgi:uncharacterized protein YigA (DUF484 family)
MKNYPNTMEVVEMEMKRLRDKEKELTRAYAEICIINRQLRDEIEKLNKMLGCKP